MAVVIVLLTCLFDRIFLAAGIYSRSYNGYCTSATIGTLRGVTLEQCKFACDSVPDCLAISYLPSNSLSVCEGKSQQCSSSPWLALNLPAGPQWSTLNKGNCNICFIRFF